jgi:hypothetical protein
MFPETASVLLNDWNRRASQPSSGSKHPSTGDMIMNRNKIFAGLVLAAFS